MCVQGGSSLFLLFADADGLRIQRDQPRSEGSTLSCVWILPLNCFVIAVKKNVTIGIFSGRNWLQCIELAVTIADSLRIDFLNSRVSRGTQVRVHKSRPLGHISIAVARSLIIQNG
jgi:hypothetical protein